MSVIKEVVIGVVIDVVTALVGRIWQYVLGRVDLSGVIAVIWVFNVLLLWIVVVVVGIVGKECGGREREGEGTHLIGEKNI